MREDFERAARNEGLSNAEAAYRNAAALSEEASDFRIARWPNAKSECCSISRGRSRKLNRSAKHENRKESGEDRLSE